MHTKRFLPLIAALFALVAGASHAQTVAAPQTTGSVRVSSNAYYHVTAQEASEIERQYRLSNGQRLEVLQQGSHFYGRLIDDREMQPKPSVRITPVGSGQFATQKGAMFAFSNAGEQVTIDNAQLLSGLRLPADVRSISGVSVNSVRLVSR
ncbi:hypothetical protein LSO07_09000 [Janthinobacterium sp. PLB04]|uniref:Gel scht n=1 Tax=Janthinobacterium lividum TaxID=29581 RepID=A0AAJ4T785_9BURK|nr:MULTISPECIES: hypothetical protein [Janthinobacterium]KAB0331827.1 hypothetical protein F3B38_09075 [Janthinobacterium lividum]QSX98027.1 hypothetical protein J3P46_08990 [Janthinobacterium lividum]UGQ37998.1 hypothetical protein LSO07_09000 [Janthinobacterium sp. PLB04]